MGGGSDALDPLVRDISMRAGGPEAVRLYQNAKEEGYQVSFQALLSVIEGCNDINIIVAIMEAVCIDKSWIVDGNHLEILHRDDSTKTYQLSSEQLERLVLTFLRKTNHSSEFGLSLLCFEFLLSNYRRDFDWHEETANCICETESPDDILSAMMTALCGFGASKRARSLYEAVGRRSQEHYHLSFDIYQFIESPREDNWLDLHRELRKLVAITSDLPNDTLTSSQMYLIVSALAKAVRYFNNARHPRAGLFLSMQMQTKFLSLQKTSPNVGAIMRSFLGVKDDELPNALLATSDELLAETLRAKRIMKMSDQALSLFEETMEKEPKVGYSSMPLAVNEAFRALIDIEQLGLAIDLFQSIDESGRIPQMFVTLSQALEREQQWEMIGQLYRESLQSGCLTEELGIMALKAINEIPNLENKLRIMRQIVSEICKVTGQVDSEWQYEKYWKLRRKLGRRYARLLMWWNDPKTSDIQELQLAIEQFVERKSNGLQQRHDALRAIIRHSRHYQTFSELSRECRINLPVEKEMWKDLVLNVALEAQKSVLRDDSRFIEDLVAVLRKFEEFAKAGEYLSDAILRGVQIDKSFVA